MDKAGILAMQALIKPVSEFVKLITERRNAVIYGPPSFDLLIRDIPEN
jgi:hypothetical protein